MQRFYESEEDF